MIEPSALSPQVWKVAELTETNSPAGGSEISSQQAMVPSVLTPQVWSSPALTEANSPAGGSEVSPQQARCRRSLRVVIRGAHGDELAFGWCCLTISIAAPAGNDAVGLYPARVVIRGAHGDELAFGWCCLTTRLPPQQATMPSVFTPHVWLYAVLTEANSPAGGVDFLSKPS